MAACSVTVTWPNRVRGGYLRSLGAPSAPLCCPPSRGEQSDAATHDSNFRHTEQHVFFVFFRKHAEVFSRGFLDFEGSQRQGEREQPTFISVCRAYAAPPARDAGLLPLQESRVAVLLSSLHDRVPAPSVPTDAPAPQGGFSTLRLTVLSLGPVEATLITQRREPQPRTGDIPSRVLGP